MNSRVLKRSPSACSDGRGVALGFRLHCTMRWEPIRIFDYSFPCRARESGGGPPHSKTLRDYRAAVARASVLECVSPLALWSRQPAPILSHH